MQRGPSQGGMRLPVAPTAARETMHSSDLPPEEVRVHTK
jgi:hypothetical protein